MFFFRLVISRYVYGIVGLVFFFGLLIILITKGKSVENEYLENLSTEMELYVCLIHLYCAPK